MLLRCLRLLLMTFTIFVETRTTARGIDRLHPYISHSKKTPPRFNLIHHALYSSQSPITHATEQRVKKRLHIFLLQAPIVAMIAALTLVRSDERK